MSSERLNPSVAEVPFTLLSDRLEKLENTGKAIRMQRLVISEYERAVPPYSPKETPSDACFKKNNRNLLRGAYFVEFSLWQDLVNLGRKDVADRIVKESRENP